MRQAHRAIRPIQTPYKLIGCRIREATRIPIALSAGPFMGSGNI
ncbi:hypothetical protein HMPREF1545_02614 [Oscillibacter sp. KLE 1728]|nr:hypothetical protein HMPREF1545_02614 [Oscillibacter sp. KLE 1728]